MAIPTSIITPLRSTAHYLDQAQVINRVNNFIGNYGVHGAFLGKFAYDMATASPEKRKDVLIEDSLVLGPTWAATYASLGELSEHADLIDPIKKLSNIGELRTKYPTLSSLFDKVDKKDFTKRGELAWTEIKNIVGTVYKNKEMVKDSAGRTLSQAGIHLDQIFPLPGEHEHGSVISGALKKMFGIKDLEHVGHNHAKEEIKEATTILGKTFSGLLGKRLWEDKMVKFFTLGGLIVVAGLAGGLVADAVRGIHEKKAKVDKIKEGIFQFIANIAMCAVGATIGMTVADAALPEKMMQTAKNPQLIRLGRFVTIMAGLSIGIVGGGFIANWVGRNFVNPFFEWMDNRHKGMTLGQAIHNAKNQNDRKVEFMDAILHLDDLPTALALAGVQIFVPFIPLFFAVSGYRTGKGYRNQGDANTSKPGASAPVTYTMEQRQAAWQKFVRNMTPEQSAKLQQYLLARQQQQLAAAY